MLVIFVHLASSLTNNQDVIMEQLFEILKLILPAGVVFLTTYYLVKNFLAQDIRKQTLDAKQANQQLITPIRLQAYERMVLFLERINPNSIVMRANINVPASVLEAELVKIVRSEFEHNLSQQIYMSKQAWENVVKAKDETVKLINVASSRVNGGAPGMELAQSLLAVAAQLTSLPAKEALDFIKKEIAKEF
jgi:hypothetical protein